MPRKKIEKPEETSLDNVLDTTAPEVNPEDVTAENINPGIIESGQLAPQDGDSIDISSNSAVVVESFESAEVAALKAELAEAREALEKATRSEPDRPAPEASLTPEQKQIRDLQHQLAQTKGQSLDTLKEEIEEVGEDGILIHILEDGFTALGRVFYRGQEVLVGPKAYEDTKNRFGSSWLSLSEDDQYARWGTVKFRKGPWPGKRQYEDEAASKSIRSVAPVINI